MLPLVDRYGRVHDYLRISVTDRCNLRCIYCMPSNGVICKPRSEVLTFEEIARIAELMAQLGVKKIRLTGGEPTVRKDLELLIAKLANIEGIETVGMTTNGVLLTEQLYKLKTVGLNALNISLDTLRKNRFEQIALRNQFDKVMRGIEFALQAGFVPLKINTVVLPKVNDDELLDFVEFVKDKPINVRFIEYMPFKGNKWDSEGFVSYFEMKRAIETRYELIPISNTNSQSNVARDFRIDNFRGTVSFITSLTENFCESCSRLRLTAHGSIKACLFYPAEVNLRKALRESATDETLMQQIRTAILRKPKGHPSLDELALLSDTSMVEIGG